MVTNQLPYGKVDIMGILMQVGINNERPDLPAVSPRYVMKAANLKTKKLSAIASLIMQFYGILYLQHGSA